MPDMPNTIARTKSQKVTIYLPSDLLAAADKAVKTGGFRSRNELVAAGMRHMIRQINREAIDAEFAAAADDEEYQAEDSAITAEFEAADIEAYHMIDLD